MKHLTLPRALLCGAALTLSASVGHAQPNIAAPQAPVAQTPAPRVPGKTVLIRLKNLPSNLVAYWLDPANQPMPEQLLSSARNAFSDNGIVEGLPRLSGDGRGPLDLKLPAGVSSVFSIDPQNALLVEGTDAGIEELRKLVALYDMPLNQTGVEAQVVEMPIADFNALKLPFRWTDAQSLKPGFDEDDEDYKNKYDITDDTLWAGVCLAPRDITGRLSALIGTGRARFITAPRVTVVDGLNAQLMSRESRGLLLQPTDAAKAAAEKPATDTEDKWTPGLAFLSDVTGLSVRTVTKGDLIAMDYQLDLLTQATRGSIVMRNGQTLAVLLPQRGDQNANRRVTSRGDISLAPQTDATREQSVFVAFITARSIKRAGDNTEVKN